jgi:hypothetical protein
MRREPYDDIAIVDVADVDLTIRNINGIYTKIQDALVEKRHIALAISESSAADLSFVQLIESARLHAQDLGKSISLTQPASANIRRVLERGGFLSRPAPETLQFWLHEERTP